MQKKIVYVITSLDYGGTQKQLYYIVKMMQELYKKERLENIEPIIVSLKRGGRYKEKFISLGVKIYDLGMPEKFSLFTVIFLVKYLFRFMYIILKE